MPIIANLQLRNDEILITQDHVGKSFLTVDGRELVIAFLLETDRFDYPVVAVNEKTGKVHRFNLEGRSNMHRKERDDLQSQVKDKPEA